MNDQPFDNFHRKIVMAKMGKRVNICADDCNAVTYFQYIATYGNIMVQ